MDSPVGVLAQYQVSQHKENLVGERLRVVNEGILTACALDVFYDLLRDARTGKVRALFTDEESDDMCCLPSEESERREGKHTSYVEVMT